MNEVLSRRTVQRDIHTAQCFGEIIEKVILPESGERKVGVVQGVWASRIRHYDAHTDETLLGHRGQLESCSGAARWKYGKDCGAQVIECKPKHSGL